MLQKDTNQPNHLIIESYADNEISISGQGYALPVLITPTQVITDITDWQQQVLALAPDIVLFGTGDIFKLPDQAQFAELYEQNIGVEAMNNASACRTHVALLSEGRNVVTVLHPIC